MCPQEEDPPVVMDIHRVETTEDLSTESKQPVKVISGSAGVSKNVEEVLSSARKIGGPFISLMKSADVTQSQQSDVKTEKSRRMKTSSGNNYEKADAASSAEVSADLDDSLDDTIDDSENPDTEIGDGENEMEQSQTSGVKSATPVKTSPRKSALIVKQEASERPPPVVTTRRRGRPRKSDIDTSPDWTPKPTPLKRRASGRPARTIKKPRKFGADNGEGASQEDEEEGQEAGEVAPASALDEESLGQFEGREVTEEEKQLLEDVVAMTSRDCANKPFTCKLCPKAFS